MSPHYLSLINNGANIGIFFKNRLNFFYRNEKQRLPRILSGFRTLKKSIKNNTEYKKERVVYALNYSQIKRHKHKNHCVI